MAAILDLLSIFFWWFVHSIESTILCLLPKRLFYKDIAGEIVLITGAGSGLGRELAIRFAKKGCKVVLWDINTKGNEETKELVEAEGATAWTYTVDITDVHTVNKAADDVRRDAGHVTILVNNAGYVSGKLICDLDPSSINRTMNVNAISHFWTLKAFLPHMMDINHGHVVTIASMAGQTGSAQLSDYCASKFAAVGLHESLTLEMLKQQMDGIHTTCVCPVAIDTGFFKGFTLRYIPMLKTEDVVNQTMDGVLTNQVLVIVPSSLRIAMILKYIMPAKTLMHMARVMGAIDSMDNFKGRQKTE